MFASHSKSFTRTLPSSVGARRLDPRHVICFRQYFHDLPGPASDSFLAPGGEVSHEEFHLPDLPLPLARLRAADFERSQSTRGWKMIDLPDLAPDLPDGGCWTKVQYPGCRQSSTMLSCEAKRSRHLHRGSRNHPDSRRVVREEDVSQEKETRLERSEL